MKQQFIFLLTVLAFATSINAQTLVSTDVQKKNAVLEEFTGIHCGYCPAGHAIAQQLIDENPGDVLVIAIHQGGYASPSAGEPDFRTEFGDAIAGQTGLTGYPAGTVNRHLFSDLSQGSGTAIGRSGWTPAAGRILTEDSPVNVGAKTTYNDVTREITVNVELYYTGNSATSSNFINVALLQSNILGPQTNGGMGDNYVHKHMLRHLITGQWGDEITTTTAGTLIQKTYTYTIPENYTDVPCVVEDCDITVFVTESQQEILSGTQVPAIDGTTLVTGSFTEPESAIIEGTESSTSTFSMNFSSSLAGNEDFTFTLLRENAPTNWSASFSVNGISYSVEETIPLTSGTSTPITIDVVPGADAGFAKYTLSIQSVSNPNSPAQMQTVYVIGNVVTMILNNQGTWSSGTPADLAVDYVNALNDAGATNFITCDYKSFLMAANNEKLSSVENIFFNVAWTFPSFTNENVAFFTSYLEGGGNLFIAGQDVGWDTWDTANGGNGTTETQSFYTNYLHAEFISDGSSSNNSINGNSADGVFGNIGTSTLSDIYGGMYPDEIDPVGGAKTITFYNNGAKSSGVRFFNDTYKVVYLGFDPAMANDEAVRKDLIKTSYDWFVGNIVAVDNIENNINIYPNPARKFVTVNAPANSTINIYDVTGKIIINKTLTSSNQQINIEKLKKGVYFVNIASENKTFNTKLVVE